MKVNNEKYSRFIKERMPKITDSETRAMITGLMVGREEMIEFLIGIANGGGKSEYIEGVTRTFLDNLNAVTRDNTDEDETPVENAIHTMEDGFYVRLWADGALETVCRRCGREVWSPYDAIAGIAGVIIVCPNCRQQKLYKEDEIKKTLMKKPVPMGSENRIGDIKKINRTYWEGHADGKEGVLPADREIQMDLLESVAGHLVSLLAAQNLPANAGGLNDMRRKFMDSRKEKRK